MLCRQRGVRKPSECAMAEGECVDVGERREAKGGERTCR